MISTFLKAKALKDITGRVAANIVEGLKEIETTNVYFRFLKSQVSAQSFVGLLSLDIRKDETFEIYMFSVNGAAAALDLEKFLRIVEPYCEITLVE